MIQYQILNELTEISIVKYDYLRITIYMGDDF